MVVRKRRWFLPTIRVPPWAATKTWHKGMDKRRKWFDPPCMSLSLMVSRTHKSMIGWIRPFTVQKGPCTYQRASAQGWVRILKPPPHQQVCERCSTVSSTSPMLPPSSPPTIAEVKIERMVKYIIKRHIPSNGPPTCTVWWIAEALKLIQIDIHHLQSWSPASCEYTEICNLLISR